MAPQVDWSAPEALPREITSVVVPPIKCQGIKTKLVPFIARSVIWSGEGRWVEPFLGSGVVLFNIHPRRAIGSDANPHIVRFYRDLANGAINPARVREHLETEGPRLVGGGADYYYEVRERFNRKPHSLDFLFLNRSCFNGLMRFNRTGLFNVPFGHKPQRFSRAYVTKIVNQVARVQHLVQNSDWKFEEKDWREAITHLGPQDFVYADPPYSGRFSDYYTQWLDGDLLRLHEQLEAGSAPFAISTWMENRYRRNEHFDFADARVEVRTVAHYYHLGATEALRNSITEALILRPGSATRVPQPIGDPFTEAVSA